MLLNSLDHIHASACRIINCLPFSQGSSSCLLQCNWLPNNCLYKRCILLKMHQIKFFVGAAPTQILEMFSISSRSRFCYQFNIIRVKFELGRSSLQYRGPNIWNFINKKVKLCNVSKEGLKATIILVIFCYFNLLYQIKTSQSAINFKYFKYYAHVE